MKTAVRRLWAGLATTGRKSRLPHWEPDNAAEAGYLYVRDGQVARTLCVNDLEDTGMAIWPQVNIDVDDTGKVIGVEVLW